MTQSPNDLPLNAAQRQSVEKMQRSGLYKSIQHVRVGDLASIQKKGTLPLLLPGSLETVEAKATRVESYSPTNFKWFGRTKDGGTGILINEDGKVYGHIATSKRAFAMHGLENGISVLSEIDPNSFKGEECVLPPKQTDQKRSTEAKNPGSARLDECFSSIRVLVLSTQSARDTDPLINQTINTAIEQFNSALFNSSSTWNARLQLAAHLPIAFNESDNAPLDADRIAFDANLDIENTLRRRADIRADIVLLFAGNTYVGARGAVRDVDTAPRNAYGTMMVGSAANAYTLAHEVGHMFGGGHQDDFINVVPYAHGKRFDVHRWPFVYRYSTLMHTWNPPGGDNWSRVLHFSNPDVSYDGTSTGDANTADVARRIDERAQDIMNFVEPVNVLSARVEGPTGINYGQQATWQSVYSCGQGPYSFEWSESPDGFNYSPLSTSENLTSTLHYATTYLRLRVTSGDGQQAFGFWTVYVNGGGGGSRMAYTDNPFESVPGSLNTYPNPADEGASIEFVLGEACDIKLELLDPAGKVLKLLAEGPHQAGSHVKTLKTAGLVNGFYVCRLSAGGKSLTNKVVVARKQ